MSTSRLERARADRDAGRYTFVRFFHENGLSVLVLLIFLACMLLQTVFGLRAYNSDRQQHGKQQMSLSQYLHSGHFLEATAENWESEFLQMGMFVWLTACFYQKGSPESDDPYDPDKDDREQKVTPDSPWPVHRGGWVLALYSRSLSVAFFIMFFISFFLHALGGAWLFSEEQIQHGEAPVTVWNYFCTSHFWFESFQNWQSEFLSIVAMVVLAIFLRHKGSAESKPVAAPHSSNE